MRWKNFLSYGNYWTEVALDAGEVTVISGKNGSGKSVLIDSIFFALTGSPYRNIKKGGLVNSINGKNCVVELEFDSMDKNYIIKRGIFPNYFEIYENDILIPVDGNVYFYQEKLDKITSLTQTTIKNTLLVNSSLKSFMNLTKWEKRTFIDETFPNLAVFAEMQHKQKEKSDEISLKMQQMEIELSILHKTLEHQKEQLKQYYDIIEKIKIEKEKDRDKIKENIDETNKLLVMYNENLSVARNELKDILLNNSDIKEKEKEISEKEKELKKLKNKLNEKTNTSIESVCLTCGQDLPENKILELQNNLDKEIELIQNNIIDLEKEITEKKSSIVTSIIDVNSIESYIVEVEKTAYSAEQFIKSLNKNLKSSLSTESVPEKPEIDIEGTKEKIIEIKNSINSQKEILRYLKEINKILLDGELKSYIISNYIPFINKHMNYYLELFNFNIKIKFDSEFEWIIYSKQYKNYRYDNFSTGEKMRINLALMFTFIQLSKIINFNSLNLIYNMLAIDEFIDNGMDVDGIDECLNLISEKNRKEKLSIFIISHKFDPMSTDFKVKSVTKERNFSRMR